MTTTKQQLRELIALHLVPNLGAQRIRALLKKVDDPQDIFRFSQAQLTSVYGIGEVTARQIMGFDDWEEVDKVIEKTEQSNYQLLTYVDDVYPRRLKEIYDPPILLWIRGNAEVLATDSVAIVGTRGASAYGKEMAERFAGKLVEAGLTIVSGLAYGIDAAAHRGTLRAGGRTIAVLGSGIDRIYPSKNIRLAFDMADQGGAVISEFPPGTPPDSGNFPVRNRIVSGLSLGTLVVESGLKGGSMITATSALDQNREVFVIPHSLRSKTGAGCNHLIKTAQGKLVQKVDDILNEIAVHRKDQVESDLQPSERKWETLELDELSTTICELLEDAPRHIDEIGEELEQPTHELLPKLLELEMQECVRQLAGKNFELV
ncbi:DNA-processing protein DprA [Aliifodinibius sp. S!AR15-10]|uniref:DNA-processing protein DprA n=1 Tax=Aliifodinibius sp. S!AR15-10 TaxID=2950437 RepID=UPI0028559173|nr:DNA-processing protein DprA [Aliifodinibius sp. S!AR15-10]MDR8389738.1 DNA-processing protein DprA [Aliifodinibius sp. S!AR15-10]